jgi:hypothetical protein
MWAALRASVVKRIRFSGVSCSGKRRFSATTSPRVRRRAA